MDKPSHSFIVTDAARHFKKKKKSKSKDIGINSDESDGDMSSHPQKKPNKTPRSKTTFDKWKSFANDSDSDVSSLGQSSNESSNAKSFNKSVSKMLNKSLNKNNGRMLITEIACNDLNTSKGEGYFRVRTPVRQWAEDFVYGTNDELQEEDKPPTRTEWSTEVDIETGSDTDLEMEGVEEPRSHSGTVEYIENCNRLGVLPVSYFVRHIQDREFIMKHHGLGPLGAKAISTPLECNTSIERINLEGNDIQQEGAKYLCRMLRENLYISDLILPENSLGSEGVRHIFKLLCDNNTINRLDLSRNKMEDRDGGHLAAMLEANGVLRFLYLRNNNLSDQASIGLKDALANNETLELLDLSWNHFRGRAAAAISEGIAENVGLKYLNLSMNGFGAEGSIAMGKALTTNRSLRELDLSWNRISFDGAAGLAKGLSVNEDLKVLRMGNNPITASGALVVLKAISAHENCGVEFLDLLEVFVNTSFIELKFILEEQRTIEIIHGAVSPEHLGAAHIVQYDFEAAFERDPMTILKRYAQANGLRLVDLFRQFDKDNSMSVSKDEFVLGVQSAGIEISDQQIDRLMRKLDKDGDGEIDYGELMDGDRQNKETKRMLRIVQQENMKKQEEVENNPLMATTVVHKGIDDLNEHVNSDHTGDVTTSLQVSQFGK